MVTRTRPHVRRMAVAVAVTLGVGIATLSGPSSADVTNIGGQAFGASANVVVPITGAVTRPPAPIVTLPPGGTQTAENVRLVAGPAVLFSTESVTVSSTGQAGPGGFVESSVVTGRVNTSGNENFSAAGVQSRCRIDETQTIRSTTITGGTVRTDSGIDLNNDNDYTDPGEHAPVDTPVPTNPPPNTVIPGHLHIGEATETFEYIFNEQLTGPDGTLIVNAVHLRLIGPGATGDVIIGQSACRATVTATPTTVTPTTATPTTATPTTVTPTTVTPTTVTPTTVTPTTVTPTTVTPTTVTPTTVTPTTVTPTTVTPTTVAPTTTTTTVAPTTTTTTVAPIDIAALIRQIVCPLLQQFAADPFIGPFIQPFLTAFGCPA